MKAVGAKVVRNLFSREMKTVLRYLGTLKEGLHDPKLGKGVIDGIRLNWEGLVTRCTRAGGRK